MASRDLTPSLQADASPVGRPSRQDVDEIDWTQCDWPTEGRYRDLFWATKNGMTVRNLREWVYRHGIPYRRVGQVIWIDAADMSQCLQPVTGPPPTKTRRPTTQRKKRPSDGQTKKPTTGKR